MRSEPRSRSSSGRNLGRKNYLFAGSQLTDIDGVQFFVYTPRLIIAEKLRALCQKLPEYTTEVLKQRPANHEKARARDFYDIYMLMERFEFDYRAPEFSDLLKHVFDAKHVPLGFIKRIRSMKQVHSQDYEALRDTISDARAKERGFDFYFDYVLDRFESIFD